MLRGGRQAEQDRDTDEAGDQCLYQGVEAGKWIIFKLNGAEKSLVPIVEGKV